MKPLVRPLTALAAPMLLAMAACQSPQPAPLPADRGSTTAMSEPVVRRVVMATAPTTTESNHNRFIGPFESIQVRPMYEFLIGHDQATGKLVPQLATEWKLEPDGASFRFKLKQGVPFQKGHGDFTAQDAKWNLEYSSRSGQFKDKKLPVNQFDWMYEGMTAVETPDPQTVVVRFNKPFVPFVNYMATEVMTMGAREVFEQDGSLQRRMVGTGPFIHDEASTQKGARWVFKKNPSYWEPGKPYLDEIRYLVLPDDPTTVAALRPRRRTMAATPSARSATRSATATSASAAPIRSAFRRC